MGANSSPAKRRSDSVSISEEGSSDDASEPDSSTSKSSWYQYGQKLLIEGHIRSVRLPYSSSAFFALGARRLRARWCVWYSVELAAHLVERATFVIHGVQVEGWVL